MYGFAGDIVAAARRGGRREALQSVTRHGVTAVVGRVDAAPPVTAEALRAHDAAVRRLARGTAAFLPARFGAVLATEKDLAEWLEPRRPMLVDALSQVRGCVQMTLRVFGEAVPLPAPVSGGPGTRHLQERLRTQQVPEVAPLLTAMATVVKATRTQRHDRPPLLASVYHLVPRGSSRVYRSTLRRAAAGLPGFRVEATGQWPVYGFAPELA